MAATASTYISLHDPTGAESDTWQPDLLLLSLFRSAAALLRAIQDPIGGGFRPRPVETLLAAPVQAMEASSKYKTGRV